MPKSSLRFTLAFSLALLPAFWSSACSITTCEEGATCEGDDEGSMGGPGADDDDGHACPSDPSPGDDDASGGSGSGSGGAGSGAGGEGGSAVACEKSCECPEGESCVDGTCVAPEPDPQPVSCVDDCDCPSGQICASGTCG